MRRTLAALAAVLSCGVLAVACDNSDGSSSTPTTPVTVTTDTFSGTVQPMGSDAHNFTVAQQGQVAITLTAAGPPPTIFMGLGVGTTGSDGSCTLLTSGTTTAQAGTTPQLAGTAAAGTFCVSVFDIGNQSAPITYTVTVSHP